MDRVTDMEPEIREVRGRRDLKTFLSLPEKIHAGRENWVPSMRNGDRHYFDPERNHSLSYCDSIRLLAFDGDRPAGRVMGLINPRWTKDGNASTARWGFLDVYDSDDRQQVIRALLTAVEEWARGMGMTRIIGPYGITNLDPIGFLYEGFENRATIGTNYNFEWMPQAVENEGYSKEIDFVVYRIPVPEKPPELFQKIVQRLLRRGSYELIEFRKRSEIRPWIRPTFTLMNEVMGNSDIYGFTAIDEVEMEILAGQYLSILEPRFVKLVLKDGDPVAFFIALPDVTAGLQRSRGRFYPFGFLKVLKARRETEQLDLVIAGIREEYRGRGLDAFMGAGILLAAAEAGMTVLDTHHEMESNTRVQAEMKRQGGEVYKRYRIWQKSL